MGRPTNPDIYKPWKLSIPAPVAGRLELMLTDAVHGKPIYGARVKLTTALYEWWIARERGLSEAQLPPVPSLAELRNMGTH